jgi:hypothetical protein
MANQRPLTNDEGEVLELTQEDLARFVPFSALPADSQELLSSQKHGSHRRGLRAALISG